MHLTNVCVLQSEFSRAVFHDKAGTVIESMLVHALAPQPPSIHTYLASLPQGASSLNHVIETVSLCTAVCGCMDERLP